MLLVKLLSLYRKEQLDIKMKKEVDKLVKSIQKKLELKSEMLKSETAHPFQFNL